ncbi:DUF805 domain-containing protein [Brevundimonas subvibrioides]|uniref:DUF805 domain-containing protein n=1 Tax=Brevundimonas subvibrioides TaxID=74313 RepID=UPI0022B468E7|nr:DUF805 domain-containing protein [Brevundimonas subvibrioides]
MILFRPLIRYADVKGRASRGEYCLFAVTQLLWYAVLVGLLVAAVSQDPGQVSPGVLVAVGLIGISVIGLLVPNYSVLVRRLHDTGRGAVWLVLLAPGIASTVLTLATFGTALGSVGLGGSPEVFVGTLLAGLGTAGMLGAFGGLGQMAMGVLVLLPGTRGENRFGPDPLDPTARYGGGDEGTVYDDARLEALFAEAKRANADAAPALQTAFDPPAPGPEAWAGGYRTTPAPVFGRRGA